MARDKFGAQFARIEEKEQEMRHQERRVAWAACSWKRSGKLAFFEEKLARAVDAYERIEDEIHAEYIWLGRGEDLQDQVLALDAMVNEGGFPLSEAA